ncbi:hypothetical protein [Spirosoma litoris]
MFTKYLLVALVIFIAFGCKKSPDLDPNSIRLTKVEYFYGFGVDLSSIYQAISSLNPTYHEDYYYDSQGRPIEKRVVYGDSISHSYKAEYDANGHINKITLNYIKDDFKTSNAVFTYSWASDSIIAIVNQADGLKLNFLFELNENRLPIRKVLRRTGYTPDPEADFRITYDANSNITMEMPGMQEYRYDLSKFNPYACSYELRLFTVFTYPFNTIYSTGTTPLSNNWVSKRIYNQTEHDPYEQILESNSIGYVTITRDPTKLRRYSYN